MILNPLIENAVQDLHRGSCCVNKFCKSCGSHVSGYNCNQFLIHERPEGAEWDWWVACDNSCCVNAYGEGFFQSSPDWVGIKNK